MSYSEKKFFKQRLYSKYCKELNNEFDLCHFVFWEPILYKHGK